MSSPPHDIVPETLLALAKDERYVRQCHDLLQQAYEGHNQAPPVGLAWLLYALLAVRQRQRTLGMEICGIKVNGSSRRLWLIVALTASLSIMVEHHLGKKRSISFDTETLRGRARRLAFEQQRRAMLLRAAGHITTTTSTGRHERSHAAANEDESRSSTYQRFVEKLKKLYSATVVELSSSTMIEHGPNSLPHGVAAISSLAKWILRLQLAHYCWTGKFVVWDSLGIGVESERSNLLANKPNLHRLVSFLVVQQAVAQLVRGAVKLAVGMWVHRGGNNSDYTPNAVMEISTDDDVKVSPYIVCGICRLDRVHPAVPKACGHVFCWKCLYQWVSATRPECPLCRAPCRPQDILPLYHYHPSTGARELDRAT